VALLTNSTRTADIVADTEIDAMVIPRSRFVNFVSGTEFGRVLQRVIESRDEKIWNLLVEAKTFARLTDYQRMWMETRLQPQAISGNSTIAAEGDALPGLYIVQDGEVVVAKDGEEVGRVGRGEAIGMLDRILRDASSEFTFRAAEPVSLLYLSKADAADFVERNPGIAMRIESRYS
ncbi:MAG: cyclic nucleotide-binding domain-containing protein, partial [Spirochaetia bacterium]